MAIRIGNGLRSLEPFLHLLEHSGILLLLIQPLLLEFLYQVLPHLEQLNIFLIPRQLKYSVGDEPPAAAPGIIYIILVVKHARLDLLFVYGGPQGLIPERLHLISIVKPL